MPHNTHPFTSLPFAHPQRTIPWEYQSEKGSKRLEGSMKRECACVVLCSWHVLRMVDAQRRMDDVA